jgi:hypothetical protein
LVTDPSGPWCTALLLGGWGGVVGWGDGHEAVVVGAVVEADGAVDELISTRMG